MIFRIEIENIGVLSKFYIAFRAVSLEQPQPFGVGVNMEHWPQIFMIVLLLAGMCLNARDHGKPKTGKDDFWVWLAANVILNFVLYCGGFWKL